MKFKTPKHFFSLLLTTTLVVLSIITPAIIFGITANKSDNSKRIPYNLFTPLPADWYLAGDIEEFDRAIFEKSFNLYEDKQFLSNDQKAIAFAKLTTQNLSSIRDFYENPILDITFDANYSYTKNETNIYTPKELDFPADIKEATINWNPRAANTEVKKEIDDFEIKGHGTSKVIPGENTVSGFSLKLLNELYRRIDLIRNDPAKFGYNPDDIRGINSYLYMIDKDLDRSSNNHNYYHIQVWPSIRANLSTHTDGKSLETIGNILKHTYNMAPATSSIVVKAWELASLGENTLGSSQVEDDFCYSDDTIVQPSELSSISHEDFKKSLRYLCAPIGPNPETGNNLTSSLTIHKTTFAGVSADEAKKFQSIATDVNDQPDAKNLHFTLGNLAQVDRDKIFSNIKNIYDHYHNHPADEIWFDTTDPSKPEEILLKIKATKFLELNKLAYNRRTDNFDWKFVWNQGIDNNGQLMGWWVIYDNTGTNGEKKAFPGQFYEKIIDNPSATALVQCDTYNTDEDKLPPQSMCKTVTVNDNKYAEIYGAPPYNNHLYFKNDNLSLGRSYQTYSGDQAKEIIKFIKDLQAISSKILNSAIFRVLSAVANEKLGGEFLELLRTIGSWDTEYWEQSADLLTPYIKNDKTIYWNSFLPLPIVGSNSEKEALEKLQYMKFGDFLNWFGNDSSIAGKTVTSENKINDYIINGFLDYQGFHSHAYTMANFNSVGATPTSLGTPNNGYELWREIGAGNQFDTTGSGIISFIIKYTSLIAYNYYIYEEKIRTTNDLTTVKANRINNLQAMLHSTYPIGDTDPLKTNFFHTKEEVNQNTNNTWPPSSSSDISIKFDDLQREMNLFQFEPWLKQILGKVIK